MPYDADDTVASALHRAGIRTFSRSFKFHRPRGLYCLSGDCPNCLCRIDGEPGVPACMTPASETSTVEREGGWPSVERDAMSVAWYARRFLPVGFYYKLVLAPWLWNLVEPLLRRAAGRSKLPGAFAQRPLLRHVRPTVLVIGAGPAGLAAALSAAEQGGDVLVVDESFPGAAVADGTTRQAIADLLERLAQKPSVEVLVHSTALAIFEGPLVPIRRRHEMILARPQRIVVATGAVESHRTFPGNDLPGVWLARGASRMTGRHGVAIGSSVVMVGRTREALDHLGTLEAAGTLVSALLLDRELAPACGDRPGLRVGARVTAAHGRRRVRAVSIRQNGRLERVKCDALVIASPRVPRDVLLRQAGVRDHVTGAGEVVEPNIDVASAIESGRRAVLQPSAAATASFEPDVRSSNGGGFACLCEDVRSEDLMQAWSEGYQSTEILKRYTTMTMGPCQGAMCHHILRSFVDLRGPASRGAGPTTARPPARSTTLLDFAAGLQRPVEERTGPHHLHTASGASWEWAGPWRRPTQYRDLDEEYWAVRERVGIMDVGTLGKFRVGGRDATEFLERLYPCNVADLAPGRIRYGLLLSEAGHISDDGVICAGAEGSYYLTFTTAGADAAEAWLRRWLAVWDLRVNIVNETRSLGAINVAGPLARALLSELTSEDLSRSSFPYLHHRQLTVAGIDVRALRLGFVGELAYELHHPRARSAELWSALVAAGKGVDAIPHGLETVSRLRLEKGHIIVGQDTEFDTTPRAAGLEWAVKMDKPFFLGKDELERISERTPARRLVGVCWPGTAPQEGSVLTSDGAFIGCVTSSAHSGVLGHGVSLALVSRGRDDLVATADGSVGVLSPVPFYDPEGTRLRA